MIDVIVCDDHPIVRQGVARILLATEDVQSVREAGSAQELLELVREGPCDAVLLDVGLPGRSGLDVLRQLKHERPRLPVLVLSVHPADQYAVRALRAGASGYLTKDMTPQQLVDALKVVMEGRKYVTPDVADQLATTIERPTDLPPHETLSDREYEVLSLIASGKSVKQIARDLNLSDKTISTYRSRVLAKLSLKTNADIIRYAIRQGLVD